MIVIYVVNLATCFPENCFAANNGGKFLPELFVVLYFVPADKCFKLFLVPKFFFVSSEIVLLSCNFGCHQVYLILISRSALFS